MGRQDLKKNLVSTAIVLCLAMICYGVMGLMGRPSSAARKLFIDQKQEVLRQFQALSDHKKEYETLWQKIKPQSPSSKSHEDALNLWVKDLLAYASGEGIVFSKLEPQGVKETESGKQIVLHLIFEGNIKKFIHFVYALMEKDPLSRIGDFSIKPDESYKAFVYEITLEKILL